MKLNLRDACWLGVLAILLLAWWSDWNDTQTKIAVLQTEIRVLREREPLMEFVQVDLSAALMYVEQISVLTQRRHISFELDRASLKQVGVTPRTKVTCSFDRAAIPAAIDKMIPGKLIAEPTAEGNTYIIRGRVKK